MADEKKQQPEKPKKKSDGLSMPILIGIISGVIIVNIVIVVLVIKLVFPPAGGEENTQHGKESKVEKTETDEYEFGEDGGEEFFEKQKAIRHMETGRITTNPKGSEQFVILDLWLEYVVSEKVLEDHHEEYKEESDLMEKLFTRVRAEVISFVGSLTVEQINAIRPELPEKLREHLSDMFKKNKIKLREVIIKEFIIQ